MGPRARQVWRATAFTGGQFRRSFADPEKGESAVGTMTTNRKAVLAAAVMAAGTASLLIGTRAARAGSFVWDGSDAANNTNVSNGLNWVGDPATGPTSTA